MESERVSEGPAPREKAERTGRVDILQGEVDGRDEVLCNDKRDEFACSAPEGRRAATHGEDGIAALKTASEEGHDLERVVGEAPAEQVAKERDQGLQESNRMSNLELEPCEERLARRPSTTRRGLTSTTCMRRESSRSASRKVLTAWVKTRVMLACSAKGERSAQGGDASADSDVARLAKLTL